MDCPSCHEYVHGETHRCFIQRAPKPQEKKRKKKRQGGPRAKRGAATAGLQTPNAPEEEDVDDDSIPPLHVFFDIEAMQPHEQHIANLVVAETEDDDNPVCFGLTELKKGYFPHKFNLPEHQNYVGPVPALDYYMPETMSPEGKQALEKWHQEQRDKEVVFDFQKELVEYCKSDVRLLKQGCLTFKRLFETLTGFNPFDHITIASACNRDLRMNRMIPNSIASEPVRGWRNRVNHSNVALEWLTWCQQQPPQDIQHAGNAGEYRIPGTNFHVDGFDVTTNTVYEFHGCFWLGCPSCYPNRHEKHLRHYDRTMQDVYETTQQKIQQLREQGYTVVEMWE